MEIKACNILILIFKKQLYLGQLNCIQLKLLVEEATKKRYNSCLLNLYHDGEEGMGWHADNEKELDLSSGIASISLGATRKFLFKHRQTKLVSSFNFREW
jgi:alkylated DNA repair dioxygenase AlkB